MDYSWIGRLIDGKFDFVTNDWIVEAFKNTWKMQKMEESFEKIEKLQREMLRKKTKNTEKPKIKIKELIMFPPI